MWGLPWQPIPSACTHLPRAPRGSTGGLQQARLEEGVTLHGSHEALLRVRCGPALQREGLTQETLHPPVPGPHDVPLQDPRRGTQHQGCPVRQVWALRSSCTEHEAQKFLEAPGLVQGHLPGPGLFCKCVFCLPSRTFPSYLLPASRWPVPGTQLPPATSLCPGAPLF